MEYVVWHKSPDTDSFCSAVVYANFLGATPVVLWNANTETAFVFKNLSIAYPEVVSVLPQWSKVHLVDHNEAWQSLENRSECEILSVVDHHKIADFSTSWPLMMRVEPVGCTCTILYEMFVQSWYTIPQNDAVLMISAIMSDTLYFRSPTTTDRDCYAVEALLPVAGIVNLDIYVSQMFDAKSDVSWYTPLEIVQMDAKQFEFNGIKVGIWVMETTNPESALQLKNSLIEAVRETKAARWVQYMLFCVIDIINEHNTTFVIGQEEEELLKNVFQIETSNNVADMWWRISRKKQIVKFLDKYFG